MRTELRPQAVERLTRFLVLRQLSREEGIEVTDGDVEDEIDQMAGTGESQEAIRNAFSTDNARSAIRSAILSRKVQERLGEIAESGAEEAPYSEAVDTVEDAETEQAAETTDEPQT